MYLAKKKQTKYLKIYQSQLTDVTLWTHYSELLFPDGFAKMTDSSKKTQPLIEQGLMGVIERHSKIQFIINWNSISIYMSVF